MMRDGCSWGASAWRGSETPGADYDDGMEVYYLGTGSPSASHPRPRASRQSGSGSGIEYPRASGGTSTRLRVGLWA
jgi:hypothetical protein